MADIVPIKGQKCANCKKPVVLEFRPFCSKRCANLDLGKWLNEEYRIAAEEEAELGDPAFVDE